MAQDPLRESYTLHPQRNENGLEPAQSVGQRR